MQFIFICPKKYFYNSLFIISDKSDRMATILTGKKIMANPTDIISEPIVLGSIQIPPNGQPHICLMIGKL